jgi:type IV pilus assembly protein PilZ
MSDREHQRMPFAVPVEFRTASSFLVAYSVNLSRGGLFLETDRELEPGTDLTIQLVVPSVGSVALQGRVSWRRQAGDSAGPPGVGVEFQGVGNDLGTLIDRLVGHYEGLDVLLLCKDKRDRTALTRLIRSIIGTAEVVGAADAHLADTLLTDDVDLLIVDVDADPEGAMVTIKRCKDSGLKVPTVALTANKRWHERARMAGADEVGSNPPPFKELQRLLVRAIGRPIKVG